MCIREQSIVKDNPFLAIRHQKEHVISFSFIDKEFIKSLTDSLTKICEETCKQTFAEISKEPGLITSQSNEKGADDNVDSIEEAKLWAVSQKLSCKK